jgi:hypothetical protein
MNESYNQMVRTIVGDLQERGFRAIAAQLEGEDLPEPDRYFQISTQHWYTPDVQARNGDQLFIYEVETEESLGSQEAREKIEVLNNAAVKANGKFFLVVPEELRDSAQRMLREMTLEWGEVIGMSNGSPV